MNLCACMGPKPGDKYCYCQLKSRGMSIEHYERTPEEMKKLQDTLTEMFEGFKDG